MNNLIRSSNFRFCIGQIIEVYERDSFGSGNHKIIEGYIGEISHGYVYIWQNYKNGNRGQIRTETAGYRYSWALDPSNNFLIGEIVDKNKSLIEHEFNSNEL